MHDHNNKENSWMMWAMMICCALPFFLILIIGERGKELGTSAWIIFGGVAIMVIIHIFMMSRLHKHHDEEDNMTKAQNKDNKDNKTHSGHGCCH